jgi:hypothetical protein
MSYGVDDEYKNKGIKGEFMILADYNFFENKDQPHSGAFKGVCESDFYLSGNNKILYDDIEIDSDGYTNNQFIGAWTDYKNNSTKRCNWADFRVPNSGDLDIGSGEFSPNEKYLKFGWQTRRDSIALTPNDEAKQIKAAKKETVWWK